MKKLFLSVLALGAIVSGQAQLTGYSVVEIANHDTTGIAALAGMKTYRIYADLTNSTDEISAVYGDEESPLSLTCPTGFFNAMAGDDLADNVNPLFFGPFPDAEYDSWFTIGYAPGDPVAANVGTVGLSTAMAEFNAGGDFVLDDYFGGSWFVTTNPLAIDEVIAAGEDLQVLIAQLTVDSASTFQGSFNVQVFIQGNQNNAQQAEAFTFSSDSGAVFGCMDPAADNYNPDATAAATCVYPCALELSVGSSTPISCPGLSNGSVTFSQAGGQFGVLYGLDGNNPTLANPTFNNLTGGNHTVVAVDGAGCYDTLAFSVVVPAALSVNAYLESAVSCNGDADAIISGTATGGTGALQYSLNPTFTNPTSTLEFTGLSSGSYKVYVKDANGCTAQSPTILINNPAPINVYITNSQNASCSYSQDGVIIVTTVGGTPGSTGLQYSVNQVTYTPGTSANGSVLYVGAGTYTVYVMDVNGCTGQSGSTVNISAPLAVNLSLATDEISCFGAADGSITLAASGGTGGYAYTFNGAATLGQTFYGDLDEGAYEVTVTDLNDCTTSQTVNLVDPDPVVATATAIDISCNGSGVGFVSVTATGGTGSFTYSVNGVDYVAGGTFSVTAPGDYTVYAQDENACTSDASATVSEPDVLEVTSTSTGAEVDGGGTIDITVTGGTAPYTYVWSGPDNFFSVNEDITDGMSGNYTVTVTDSNDCETTYEVEILLGVADLSIANGVSVYPNPSTGLFQLSLEGLRGERLSMEVVDMQGRVVYSESFGQRSGDFLHVLDLSSIANGLYQLFIASDSGREALQLVKGN